MTTEFVLTRTFDAPRSTVWKAWTEADRLKRWWGPKMFEMFHLTVDLRPGGLMHYGMRGPMGEMWGRFVYGDIEPESRLTFINSFSDADGGITGNPWMPTWPKEVMNEVTFTEEGGKTTVTMRGGPINADEAGIATFLAGIPGMQGGFAGTFAQLDEELAAHPD